MKDVKVFKEFDISTPDGLNIYNLVNKLPLIMQAVAEFKNILSTVPLQEIFVDETCKNAEEKINMEKAHNAEFLSRNEERKDLLIAFESIFSCKGVTV
jgi:hypothetical protein